MHTGIMLELTAPSSPGALGLGMEKIEQAVFSGLDH